MVWGKAAGSGVDDLVKRLQANDPKLKSLTILRFRRLNDEDVAQLSSALQGNTVLQELICCSHAISSGAAAKLGGMLQHNAQLQQISIGNSSFGDEALSALVSGGLHANKSVRVWDVEHKGLSQASASSIAHVLQQHPRLQQLQLSRNSISDAGLQWLCAAPWANLTQLDLAACDVTHQGVQSLAAAPSIGQLQQLDLSHNSLGAAAAAGLAELLSKATSLQSLKLKSTQLQDEGVRGIANGLSCAAAGLHLLDLSSNQISSTGVAALAAALAQHPAGPAAVQHLVLADNPAIDDEAVCQLAASLQSDAAAAAGCADEHTEQQQTQQQQNMKQQLVLDLAHAGVGADGVAALSKVPGLTQLSLFGCKLGGDPGSAVTALFDSMTAGGFASLQELNLAGCSLTLPQLRSIMRAVAAGGSSSDNKCALPLLHTLELGANAGVQEEGFEEEVSKLRAARPGLDVHWRVADSDDAPPGIGGATAEQ